MSPMRRRVAAHVRSVRHARVRCLVVLCCHPLLRWHSTLRWYFFGCQQLWFKVHTHTEKYMRGQRMHQKIASRASSVFAPRPLAGAPYFREIRRIAWCAQVSLQSVRHRSGCEDRKTVSTTRQCHSRPSGIRRRPLRMLRVVTSRLARARQVQSQEGGGQTGLRWQIQCTQRQFLGSARTDNSVVVVSTPTGAMEFCQSTRDLKERMERKKRTHQ